MNYAEWQQKADSVFPDKAASDLFVSGSKTGIISDESRTFWNCAPPKVRYQGITGLLYIYMCILTPAPHNYVVFR